MKRVNRMSWQWFFSLSLVVLSAVAPSARAEERKSIYLNVLLPEDAELEINGYKTRSTGTTRHFESPPVEVDRRYRYSLKVTWQGHTLTRRTEVRPEQPLTLDLRKELEALAAPKAAGSFALLAPPVLMLRADGQLIFPLRVRRFDFADPIHIHFENLPRGITIPALSLSEDQSENRAMLFAAGDAEPGAHEIRVTAESRGRKEVATIKITVARAEIASASKPETNPATPPRPKTEPKLEPNMVKIMAQQTSGKSAPPAKVKTTQEPSGNLSVVAPTQVVLQAGQSEYVEIKAVMLGQEPFAAEPSISLTAARDSNLTCEMWTAFDFKTHQPERTIGFALKAAPESQERQEYVKVLAAVGTRKAERTIDIRIHPSEQKRAVKPPVSVSLQLIAPTEVRVSRGKTTYLEMRLQTQDGSPFSAPPNVMLVSPSDCGLRFEPWMSSFKPGDSLCTLGVAVSADTTVQAGTRAVRIRAASGPSTAEQSLHVTVDTRP